MHMSNDEPNHDGLGWALLIGGILGWVYGKIYFDPIDRFWVWVMRHWP